MVMLGLKTGVAWMVTGYGTPSRARRIKSSCAGAIFGGSGRQGEGGLARMKPELEHEQMI